MVQPSPPERIAIPAAWRADGVRAGEWVHRLSPPELAEIEAAAKDLVFRCADLATVSADDFPVPRLAAHLRRILEDDVLGGRGFAVIRGLDPNRLTRAE